MSNEEQYKKPLVLISDLRNQVVHRRAMKSYPSPPFTRKSISILSLGLQNFAEPAGFDFVGHPGYQLFDLPKKRTFWKPLMKKGYPIYIVSALFGLLYPGIKSGTYSLSMEETFYMWKYQGLSTVVKDAYVHGKCDCVVAYLPKFYNNIVQCAKVPWLRKEPDEFDGDMNWIKKLSTGE